MKLPFITSLIKKKLAQEKTDYDLWEYILTSANDVGSVKQATTNMENGLVRISELEKCSSTLYSFEEIQKIIVAIKVEQNEKYSEKDIDLILNPPKK